MIISPARNFIFVHIPKTGGTSLALALEDRAHRDDILIGDTPKARKRKGRLKGTQAQGRLWKHSTLADIEGLVTPGFIDGAFVATLVRNPWDRMVSYYHWLQRQGFDHPAVHLAKSVTFEEFVLAGQTQLALKTNPYEAYLRRGDGGTQAGHFIRLEQFAEDAQVLWDHLGFRLELPHENRSEWLGDYQSYYTQASRDVIAQTCAGDIARFEYRY